MVNAEGCARRHCCKTYAEVGLAEANVLHYPIKNMFSESVFSNERLVSPIDVDSGASYTQPVFPLRLDEIRHDQRRVAAMMACALRDTKPSPSVTTVSIFYLPSMCIRRRPS